jgi:hypothetical protein
LNRMPVTGSMTREPKIKFTVEEMVTTIPLASTIEVWLYTKSHGWSRRRSCGTYCAMVLRNVEDRLVVRYRMGMILIPDVKIVVGRIVSTYIRYVLRYQCAERLERYFINSSRIVIELGITYSRPRKSQASKITF